MCIQILNLNDESMLFWVNLWLASLRWIILLRQMKKKLFHSNSVNIDSTIIHFVNDQMHHSFEPKYLCENCSAGRNNYIESTSSTNTVIWMVYPMVRIEKELTHFLSIFLTRIGLILRKGPNQFQIQQSIVSRVNHMT